MRRQSRRSRGSWIGLGVVALGLVALAAGCGGGQDGGDANYSQKFDQPAGPAPEVKVKPDPHGRRDANELSPRERRALGKSQ